MGDMRFLLDFEDFYLNSRLTIFRNPVTFTYICVSNHMAYIKKKSNLFLGLAESDLLTKNASFFGFFFAVPKTTKFYIYVHKFSDSFFSKFDKIWKHKNILNQKLH